MSMVPMRSCDVSDKYSCRDGMTVTESREGSNGGIPDREVVRTPAATTVTAAIETMTASFCIGRIL